LPIVVERSNATAAITRLGGGYGVVDIDGKDAGQGDVAQVFHFGCDGIGCSE
jgi:hypothetical protein